MCHRASCIESRGYIRVREGDPGWVGTPANTESRFSPRLFDYPTVRVEGQQLSKLVDTYGLSESEVSWAGWLYCPSMSRLVMPVYSPLGARRGVIARHVQPSIVPKTLTYKEVDDPWMGWFLKDLVAIQNEKGKYPKVVVVEDTISAVKASRFYPTVALMGTHLDHEKVMELIQYGDEIVLSLDQDASSVAYKYSEQFAVYGNFRTVPLSKDIKNMNQEELGDWSERI
jgi:hypothetical protein